MPDPRSRRFFGVVLIGAILTLGVLAAGRLVLAAITQTATFGATVQAPNATQSHYRFRNDDGGEQAAALNYVVTSTWSSGFGVAAIDSQYLYLAGTRSSSEAWTIEKRSLSTGALIFATTSRAGTDANAVHIAIDSQYMYVVGDDGNGIWYLEKRDITTDALIYTVSSSAGTDFYSQPGSIYLDGGALFICGRGDISGATTTWRIEKRDPSNGALVTTFASSGVLIVGEENNAAAIPTMIVDRRGQYLYTFGGFGSWLEKFSQSDGSSIFDTSTESFTTSNDIRLDPDGTMLYLVGGSNGSNIGWSVEKRRASDGALIWADGDSNYASSSLADTPFGAMADNTYLYVFGGEDAPSPWEWRRCRIEKRRQSDGVIIYSTTSDSSAGTDVCWGALTDGQYMYIGGDQATSSFGRLERRTLGHDTSTATFSTAEDNPLLNLGLGTLTRLRMMVSNAGDVVATSSLYRLEYATSTSGPWTRVGSPASTSAHWIMGASAYVTDAQGTHNITGLTDPTSTVSAWSSGQFKSTSSQATLTSTLNASQFTEYEYAIKGTGSSTLGIPYYFRLTNNGSSLTTYSTYASATLATAGITVSAIAINNGSPIILTPNTTTTVNVNWTVSGGQGCGNVFFSGGNVTSTLYRSGVSSTCSNTPTQSTLNCYYVATTTHNCASATSSASANATTTFGVWYFAESTSNTSTASSSYPGEDWSAYVAVRNGSGTVGTSTAISGVEVYPLLAISLNSSTFAYGTIIAGQNTSGTNQTTNVKNAGNATSALQVSGNAMSNGSYAMPTSSQHYATNTFTYGGAEQQLQQAATAVSGWMTRFPLGRPTTTLVLPQPLRGNCTAAANGYLYSLGGEDGAVTTTVHYAALRANGTVSSTWTTTTALRAGIEGGGTEIVNGYLYYIGGINFANVTSSVAYAPINATGSLGAWATTTILPDINSYFGSVNYGGYIYVIGGNNGGYKSTVYFARPSSTTGRITNWSSTASLPTDRLAPNVFVSDDGYIFVAGGDVQAVGITSTVLRGQISATGSIPSWVHVGFLPTPTYSSKGVVSQGLVMIPGGVVASGETSTIMFSPITAGGNLGGWTTNPLSLQASIDPYPCNPVAQRGFVYTIGGNAGFVQDTVQMIPLPSRDLYWGLGAPATSTRGTYSSTITYTAVYSP